MKKYITYSAASLLMAALIITPTLFVAPQKAHASSAGCIGGILGGTIAGIGSSVLSSGVGQTALNSLGLGGVGSILGIGGSVPVNSSIGNTINGQTAGATVGTCIDQLILMPIARAAIKSVLQGMTGSVLSFINGSNGTGQPSYVQDLGTHLQGVGDSVALPFITQVATNLNSPFGPVIASSLRSNYAEQTSLAGFWAANQNTLPQYSSDPNAYLAGDWSKGGIAAWFGLTTQPQNNPYTLFRLARSQMSNNVTQAQINRRQDLAQSGGFLSWCGGGSANSSNGISPGDSCINPDGSFAKTLTPGSIIHDYAQKTVVGSGFDQLYAQLVSADDIDSALIAVVGSLTTQTLGGPGGLFGGSTPSSSNGSRGTILNQLNAYSDSSLNAPQSVLQSAQGVSAQLASFVSSWNTILSAANTASTSVNALITTCIENQKTAQASYGGSPGLLTFLTTTTAQINAAKTALSSGIIPVIGAANIAFDTASTTQEFSLKVQTEAVTATNGTSAALSADLATLTSMPPSALDITNAGLSASVTNTAIASPSGSLSVSGGSLVDQMNLISANAAALQAVCAVAPNLGGFH